MKRKLFHNKEISKCKVHIKKFDFLRILRFSQRFCGRYKSFGKWRHVTWVTVLYWTAQILMMEAGCLSEASVAICQPTRPRILEDLDLQTSGFEILVAVFIFKCSAMLYRSLLGNISWSLTVGPIGVSEKPVRNYHYTLQISVSNVTEEGRTSFLHSSSNCDAQYGSI
jgi:hypothetical protein